MTTVSSLRDQARQRADMVGSNFVSPTEWITYISGAYAELYDILVSKFEDYYLSSQTFSITSGNSYGLPSDFYKLRGVDRQVDGSTYEPVRQFSFEDRNRSGVRVRYRGAYPSLRYRIFGSNLVFSPDEEASGNYRIWYVPRAAVLTSDTDTVDGVNGWELYIVTDAAIKALAKEESDVSFLVSEKMALKARIEDMASNRNAGEPERITDVSSCHWEDW